MFFYHGKRILRKISLRHALLYSIFLSITFLIVYFTYFNGAYFTYFIFKESSQLSTFYTAKGNVTIMKLAKDVYNPHGYAVEQFGDEIFPKLKETKSLSCGQIFQKWQQVADIPADGDPKHLLRANYTLYGYTTMSDCFFNETFNNEPSYVEKLSKEKLWSKQHIEAEVNKAKAKQFSMYSYPDSLAIYHATKFHSIAGKNGAIIGSQLPWVEILCLANGAKSLTTIDYQQLRIDHPDIKFLLATDLVQNWEVFNEKFDFIVSFSSIEHSGLGRYGDPIDPFGDIKEMQKIRCILKRGGILFLGVPIGWDNVGYNCHRTYGRIRLPMMFAGYELVNTFYMDEMPIKLDLEEFYKKYYDADVSKHYVFALRKI